MNLSNILKQFKDQGYVNFGKYFRIIEESREDRKTSIYRIYNHDIPERTYLGEIKWNGAWRKYCFYPAPDTLWDTLCLQSIVDFIDLLMEARKK